MIDLTNETNMLDFMAALRKHDYKGLKEQDRYSPLQKAIKGKDDCKCLHGHETCCEHEELLKEDKMRKDLINMKG